MSFRPYLFFGGTCRQAFTRYHEIFGGDLEIMSFGDLPPRRRRRPATPTWSCTPR